MKRGGKYESKQSLVDVHGSGYFGVCRAGFSGPNRPRPVYAQTFRLLNAQQKEAREQEFRRVNTDFVGPIQVSKTGVIDCAYLSQASFTNMGYCRSL